MNKISRYVKGTKSTNYLKPAQMDFCKFCGRPALNMNAHIKMHGDTL